MAELSELKKSDLVNKIIQLQLRPGTFKSIMRLKKDELIAILMKPSSETITGEVIIDEKSSVIPLQVIPYGSDFDKVTIAVVVALKKRLLWRITPHVMINAALCRLNLSISTGRETGDKFPIEFVDLQIYNIKFTGEIVEI